MNMMMELSAMPLWQSAQIVVVLPTLFGIAGPLVLRHLLGLDRLKINNEVAGFKFAVVGVIYAVILGFATIVVWEKFRDADTAVTQEAAAVLSLERLARAAPAPAADAIEAGLQAYTRAAVAADWPAMARGRGSPVVAQALDSLYSSVLSQNTASGAASILPEMLYQLDNVTQARRARLSLAGGIVPSLVWTMLFAGAIVTVVFTFFFGAESIAAQTMMNALLTFLVFLVLFVVLAIDHPFTGPVRVSPEPLMALMEG